MFMRIAERKVKCSKCGSIDIAKPVNEDALWVYKCLDCGHTKDKEDPILTTTHTKGEDWYCWSEEEFNKPIEF